MNNIIESPEEPLQGDYCPLCGNECICIGNDAAQCDVCDWTGSVADLLDEVGRERLAADMCGSGRVLRVTLPG